MIRFQRLLAVLLLPLLTGCVERKLLIRSDPEGAVVLLDEDRIGETPVEVPFVYYGTRRIAVSKKGHRPVFRTIELHPPWYQYFPLDFFFEVIFPFTMTDTQLVDLELRPHVPGSLTEEEVDALEQRGAVLEQRMREALREGGG